MARPEKLNPLFANLRGQKGVGPQVETAFRRLFQTPEGLSPTVLDALMHMPFAFVDRSKMESVRDATAQEQVTLQLHIDQHIAAPKIKRPVPHRVICHDETGEITLVFFGNKGGWIERSLPEGEMRVVSGQIGIFQGQKQITHPDLMVTPAAFAQLPPFEAIYPQVAGLNRRLIGRIIRDALKIMPTFSEWVHPERMAAQAWPSFGDALKMVHAPMDNSGTSAMSPARQRLAYDEYLAGQLTLQIVRSRLTRPQGQKRNFNGRLMQKLREAIPYALTDDQNQVVEEILQDLGADLRMSRLVQGDVGAGKTIVAMMAMAAMAEDGAQSCLMAPTEILASQHYKTLLPLCEKLGLGIELLTGKMGAKARREALERISSGNAQIIVGTHALFQSDVVFNQLGLVVVDEQHRFGVHQRLALSDKGENADLLVMTATPIPRTLVLTHFGDMAVSQIKSKPKGRQKIDTAALPASELDRVIGRLKTRVGDGAQAYWVCPLVEESDELDLVSAEERFQTLQKQFGDQVGLIHGRMKAGEKQAVMEKFQSGDIAVLVATTVIEVGVDVPNATIMIIEHAERFGLAQLHQLRGRVGRGTEKSACLLLHKERLGEIAQARLETIVKSDDGFEIAEKDLELRGQGELLGTKQSGAAGFALALPEYHGKMLSWAHEDAQEIMAQNPTLQGAQGEALRELLYIFKRDLALPLLRAG